MKILSYSKPLELLYIILLLCIYARAKPLYLRMCYIEPYCSWYSFFIYCLNHLELPWLWNP